MNHLKSLASWIVILAGVSIAAYAYAAIPKMPKNLPDTLCRTSSLNGISVEELIRRGAAIDPRYGTVDQALDLSD